MLSQTVDKTPIQAEQHVRNVSKNPTKSPKPELRAVFVSMDVTSSASQQKRFVNRLGQFVASQLRKRKVEVSVSLVHDEEMISARTRRQQREQLQDEETTCPKRHLDKDWVEDWLTDDIHQYEPNLDEAEYERAFVNDSLPELLEQSYDFSGIPELLVL